MTQQQNLVVWFKSRKQKSNSNKIFTLATLFVAIVATFILTACSDESGNRSFSSSDEAIKAYSEYLSNLKTQDRLPVERFATAINQWQVLDDSVRSCLERDTVGKPHNYPMEVYKQVNDSIHKEFIRIAASKARSFHDLLYVKERTSKYAKDDEIREAAAEARPFFCSLDSLPVNNKSGKTGVMKRYRKFLKKSVKANIQDKADLLGFIKNEHYHYRAFLQHLPELADESMADITKNTEQCCVQILQAADRKAITHHKDAMIHLAMRTNMRLIRNAQVAIADLKSGKVKSESVGHAYLWMLIQPISSMDDLSLAVMSDKDLNDLYKIADALPSEMNHLAKMLKLDKGSLSEMPTLLLKMYLTRL